MDELFLNIKSQLVYVLENQLKIKHEIFLKKYGTPDNPDVLNDYYWSILDGIIEILQENYVFIKDKSQSLLNKLPGINDLSEEDRNTLNNKLDTFIDEELSIIFFDKIINEILN